MKSAMTGIVSKEMGVMIASILATLLARFASGEFALPATLKGGSC